MFGGVLPLDDVDSGDIDLAGRMAEFVGRVRAAADALKRPQPIASWTRAIATAADALTATSDRDSWQRTELQRILGDALADATATADPTAAEAVSPSRQAAMNASVLARSMRKPVEDAVAGGGRQPRQIARFAQQVKRAG